ncbi:MAG: hypothetical protein MUO63_06230 [Desulfobulbaceae bacterium]|nr:hypothetical protein [Desulfobulbaceae bacterium]
MRQLNEGPGPGRTLSCIKIYDYINERDHATNNFLQWFVAEQVEEEASASSVLEKFKLIGKDKSGLFAIDLELAKRVFTPPAR